MIFRLFEGFSLQVDLYYLWSKLNEMKNYFIILYKKVSDFESIKDVTQNVEKSIINEIWYLLSKVY